MQYGEPFNGTSALIDLLVNERLPQEHPFFLLISGGVGTGKPVYLRMLKDAGIADKNVVVIEPRSFLSIDKQTGQTLFPEIAKYADVQHPEKLPHLIQAYYASVRDIVQAAVDRNLSIVLMDHGENLDFLLNLRSRVRSGDYEEHNVLMTCTRESYLHTTLGRQNNPDIARTTDNERFLEQHRVIAAQHDRLVRLFKNTTVTFKDVEQTIVDGQIQLKGLPPTVISKVKEEVIDGEKYDRYRQQDWSDQPEITEPGVDKRTVGQARTAGNGAGNGGSASSTKLAEKIANIADNLPDLFRARELRDKQDRKDKKL